MCQPVQFIYSWKRLTEHSQIISKNINYEASPRNCDEPFLLGKSQKKKSRKSIGIKNLETYDLGNDSPYS
jgi:hypothetical protein